MNIKLTVRDVLTAHRAAVIHRVISIICQEGEEMTSTNYYIVHKTGRRLKVSCIGFCHDKKLREAMRLNVAKVEHGRTQDYKIEEEQTGRRGTLADYKEFTL